MARDDDPVGGEIKAAIAFVIRGITKKDAQSRARSKFMWGSGSEIRIASTPKNPKFVVGRVSGMEGEVRCRQTQRLGGKTVDQIGGSGKSVHPIGGRHGGLKQ
jgi:hypothetical protein